MQQQTIEFYDDNKKLPSRIIINGLPFTKNNSKHYYCRMCRCTAKVQTNDDDNIIGLDFLNEHDYKLHPYDNHQKCVEAIKSIRERKERKQNIGIALVTKPNEKGDKIATNFGESDLTPQQLTMLKHNTKKKYQIPNTWEEISQSQYSLVLGSIGSRIIIFGLNSGLYFLSKSEMIFAHGTFKIVRGEGQMFIIHGIINNVVVSCLFVKMEHMTAKDYALLFQLIEKIAETRGYVIFNRSVIFKADFEQSVMISLSVLFPQIQFSGCFFHYSQSIIRNIRTRQSCLGYYNTNKDFKVLVKRIISCALLPLRMVNKNTLDLLFLEYKNAVIPKNRPKDLEQFYSYLLKTWFGSAQVLFHPSKWNFFESKKRNNNDCESLHRVLNSEIKKKIELSGVIDLIKETLKKDKKKLESTELNSYLRTSKTVNSLKNVCIDYFKNKIIENEIFITDYLDVITLLVSLNKIEDIEQFKINYLSERMLNCFKKNKLLKLHVEGFYSVEIITPKPTPKKLALSTVPLPEKTYVSLPPKKSGEEEIDVDYFKNDARLSEGFMLSKIPLKKKVEDIKAELIPPKIPRAFFEETTKKFEVEIQKLIEENKKLIETVKEQEEQINSFKQVIKIITN